MEEDHGMASPSSLSTRGAGAQMSPSNSETSESRCMYLLYLPSGIGCLSISTRVLQQTVSDSVINDMIIAPRHC